MGFRRRPIVLLAPGVMSPMVLSVMGTIQGNDGPSILAFLSVSSPVLVMVKVSIFWLPLIMPVSMYEGLVLITGIRLTMVMDMSSLTVRPSVVVAVTVAKPA